MTAPGDPRDRFRVLPDPVSLDETVESLDTSTLPLPDEGQDRDRMLREAGGP
jgi:hypothetical protein